MEGAVTLPKRGDNDTAVDSTTGVSIAADVIFRRKVFELLVTHRIIVPRIGGTIGVLEVGKVCSNPFYLTLKIFRSAVALAAVV